MDVGEPTDILQLESFQNQCPCSCDCWQPHVQTLEQRVGELASFYSCLARVKTPAPGPKNAPNMDSLNNLNNMLRVFFKPTYKPKTTKTR